MAKNVGELHLSPSDLGTLKISLHFPTGFHLRMKAVRALLSLVKAVCPIDTAARIHAPFNADDSATWERFEEDTDEGGKIVLVRYPEGYRLRFHGETVWKS